MLFLAPNDGCDTLPRNIGSYKSLKAIHPEDGTLHSHSRENLKSYIALTGWALKRRRNVFSVS
jgi:hypothetical protein